MEGTQRTSEPDQPCNARRAHLQYRAIKLISLGGLLACGSDAIVATEKPPDEPTKPPVATTLAITFVADSVIAVGSDSSAAVTVTVRKADGSPYTGSVSLAYDISDTTVLEFANPYDAFPPRRLHAKREGDVTLTVRSGSDGTVSPASVSIRVRDPRPVIGLTLGREVQAQVVTGVSTARYAVDLRAGDTIDMRVRGGSSSATLRQLGGPRLPLQQTFTDPQTFVGIVIPQTGRYEFDAENGRSCTRGSCSYTSGSFWLSARAAGPVFAITENAGTYRIPAGRAVVETLWVHNVGSGVLTVRAASTKAFLLTDSIAVARGPVAFPVGNRRAPGAVPLAVRIDGSTLPVGWYDGGVRLTMDSSVWHPDYLFFDANTFSHLVTLNVYDPNLRVIRNQYFNAIAFASPDLLYAVDGSSIYAVQLPSGDLTRLPTPAHSYTWASMVKDGSLLVAYEKVIARVSPDGTLLPLVTASPSSVYIAYAADPGGTLFVFSDAQLTVRTPSGVTSTLFTAPGQPTGGTMAYSAVDTSLYYTRGGVLYRFALNTMSEESRGAIPNFWVLAADDKGRLYGRTLGGPDVAVYDNRGTPLGAISGPGTTSSVAIGGGMIFGAGPPSGGAFLWSKALP